MTVSTWATAMSGSTLVGDSPTPLIAVRLGRPVAGSPWSRASAVFENAWSWSVLTIWTLATPSPCITVVGTNAIMLSGSNAVGMIGPKLTGPPEVGTKKFTTEPGLNPLPWIEKLSPTYMIGGSELIEGPVVEAEPSRVAEDSSPRPRSDAPPYPRSGL